MPRPSSTAPGVTGLASSPTVRSGPGHPEHQHLAGLRGRPALHRDDHQPGGLPVQEGVRVEACSPGASERTTSTGRWVAPAF